MTKPDNNPDFSSIEEQLIVLRNHLADKQASFTHPAMAQIPEWKGADVAVTSDFTWEPQDFMQDHNLLVRTRHASALTWLIFGIRDAYGSWLDYSNKYAFYESLAKAALKHLAANQPEPEDPRPVLRAVLSVAFDWLKILRSEGFIPANAGIVLHFRDSEAR